MEFKLIYASNILDKTWEESPVVNIETLEDLKQIALKYDQPLIIRFKEIPPIWKEQGEYGEILVYDDYVE